MDLFDEQVQLRMGQCNVKKWIDDILPLVEDSTDPLGVLDLTTHSLPLGDAPKRYETFQDKATGASRLSSSPDGPGTTLDGDARLRWPLRG